VRLTVDKYLTAKRNGDRKTVEILESRLVKKITVYDDCEVEFWEFLTAERNGDRKTAEILTSVCTKKSKSSRNSHNKYSTCEKFSQVGLLQNLLCTMTVRLNFENF